MATIGKNILENLTTGMYADSKVIYREYVQNACDQIDKAVELGIIDREQAEVFISIICPKKRPAAAIQSAPTLLQKFVE